LWMFLNGLEVWKSVRDTRIQARQFWGAAAHHNSAILSERQSWGVRATVLGRAALLNSCSLCLTEPVVGIVGLWKTLDPQCAPDGAEKPPVAWQSRHQLGEVCRSARHP
jgi:hypothetical protein